MSRRVGRENVQRYFEHTTQISAQPGRIELTVPSGFVKALIEERFREPLLEAAREELVAAYPGQRVGALELSVRVDQAAFAQATSGRAVEATNRADARAQLDAGELSDLAGGGHGGAAAGLVGGRARGKGQTLLRLEDIVVGEANRIAFSAAERMCLDKCPASFSPLFIHGGCGLGKTHMLQGIARRMQERRPSTRVLYTTGEAFTNAYIAAVKGGTLESFRTAYRRIDVLCIDDVHFFSNKQATQGELLHTLDAIGLQGARVIMASDEHPKKVRAFSSQLVSRFMSGMVVKVESPDAKMREDLVRALAARRGMVLEPAAVRLIALQPGHQDSSVRDLAGDLTRVGAMAEVHPELVGDSGVIGVLLVRKALGVEGGGVGGGRGRPVRAEAIVELVCRTLRVEMHELTGRGRHPRVVLARSAATWLCRALTTHSFPEIARAIGRPNHSTVVTAHQRICKHAEAQRPLVLGRGVELPELASMNVGQFLEHLKQQVS